LAIKISKTAMVELTEDLYFYDTLEAKF